MALRRESLIKKEIMQFLQRLPNSRFEISKPGSKTGKLDITGCLQGRYVAFEVKTLVGRLTRLQVHELRELQEAGAVAAMVRSLEEVKAVLKDEGFLTAIWM